MANQSIFAAFERMWQKIVMALNNKANVSDINDIKDDIANIQNQMGNYNIKVLSVSEYENLSAYDSSTLYFCYED